MIRLKYKEKNTNKSEVESDIAEENDMLMSEAIRLQDELNVKLEECETLEEECNEKEECSKYLESELAKEFRKIRKLQHFIRKMKNNLIFD